MRTSFVAALIALAATDSVIPEAEHESVPQYGKEPKAEPVPMLSFAGHGASVLDPMVVAGFTYATVEEMAHTRRYLIAARWPNRPSVARRKVIGKRNHQKRRARRDRRGW